MDATTTNTHLPVYRCGNHLTADAGYCRTDGSPLNNRPMTDTQIEAMAAELLADTVAEIEALTDIPADELRDDTHTEWLLDQLTQVGSPTSMDQGVNLTDVTPAAINADDTVTLVATVAVWLTAPVTSPGTADWNGEFVDWSDEATVTVALPITTS